MNNSSKKAVFTAIFANSTITLGKLVVSIITGSSALLAETLHSFGDTINQIMIYVGYKRSQRKISLSHPRGYGRERYFYALIISLSIFSLGGLFALYQGFKRLGHSEEIEYLNIAIGLLIFASIFEGISFYYALKASKKERNKEGWFGYIKNSKSPEIPLLLLEDLGALLGILIALLGLILTKITGNTFYDTLASLLIGILLIVISITLFIEFKSLLIGEAAHPDLEKDIKKLFSTTKKKNVIIKTLQTSPDEIDVIIKSKNITLKELEKLKKEIKKIDKNIKNIYLEI